MIELVPRRPSVLIVDDTRDIRWLLRLAIDREGTFEVAAEAGDGRAAVVLAQQLQPDAVLLDLAMPVMDGLEALPLIRAVSPASRVVILSGFNARQLADEALALGADGYIEKGIAPGELIARLKEFCGGPGPATADGDGQQPPPPGPLEHPGGRAAQLRGIPASEFHDWLAVLFHELSTPLTAVIGFAGLLDETWDSLPPEIRHRALAGIGRSARHMRTMLSNFADVGHIDLDVLDLTLEETDIAQLVAETVADLAGATSAIGVRVVLPGPVPAQIDRTRVRQVITNLVCNATKFAGPYADVAVEVDADEDEVRVCVADDGPGIERHRQPELFGKFSRAGATAPGKGLGLYVSRAIARAHGGDITVDSDAGRGARFVFWLPRRLAATRAVLIPMLA
ncbi:MAG TPA: hybrid sensor histidine kinase/response regulator [Acidimicrobiia bacterium]|nr:hybrid sensor histidine kinase/response regulator [Acidimicrobiia bacterium]